jgi:Dolichyl-phosphate-mannose-protein mannosyltransferase
MQPRNLLCISATSSLASPIQDLTPARRITKWGAKRTLLLTLLSLALVTAVLLRGIGKGEFSENVDETVHAATGLYVASFIHDLPLHHPVEYTYDYYAQYPSLGIVMYPPVFYVVEGFAFLIFGPTVVTARLTVLVFALLGLYFWFKLVSVLEDEYTAALSTLLLAFLPGVLHYEKSVMLDIPLMAFCIAASYFWILFLRDGLGRHLYACAVFACLAFLTKHHAIYLPIWCLITLVAQKKWDRIMSWKAAITVALCFLMVAPAYIVQILMNASLGVSLKGTSADATMQWAFYWSKLPALLGWPALALSIVGILTCRWWGKRESNVVMLAWIAACYMVFTLVRHKDPDGRYILYWIPAFAFFAVAPFLRIASGGWIRVLGTATVMAVATSYTVLAWSYQRPYVSGYARLAQQLTQREGGCVLVDADLPGNLIFFMRAFDPQRRFIMLRKALHEVRIIPEWGVTEFARSQNDVERILKSDGVRYVVVDKNTPLRFSSSVVLREILDHSGDYKMLGAFPIESNQRDWQGRSLMLYESSAPVALPHGTLHIKMSNLYHDIDIPFATLTKQYTSNQMIHADR